MVNLKSLLISTAMIVGLAMPTCDMRETKIIERKYAQNCEEAIGLHPYRYRYTSSGLVYETCSMENGEPVVYTTFKK